MPRPRFLLASGSHWARFRTFLFTATDFTVPWSSRCDVGTSGSSSMRTWRQDASFCSCLPAMSASVAMAVSFNLHGQTWVNTNYMERFPTVEAQEAGSGLDHAFRVLCAIPDSWLKAVVLCVAETIRYLLNSIHTRLGLLRICWPANLDLDSATPRLWSDLCRLQKDVQYPLADNALRCVLLTSSSCMAGRDTVQGRRNLKFRSVHKVTCGLTCDICRDKWDTIACWF